MKPYFALFPAPWRRRFVRWVVMRTLLALASNGSCGAGALQPIVPLSADAAMVQAATTGPGIGGSGTLVGSPQGAECF